jgi:hypothetical protein
MTLHKMDLHLILFEYKNCKTESYFGMEGGFPDVRISPTEDMKCPNDGNLIWLRNLVSRGNRRI